MQCVWMRFPREAVWYDNKSAVVTQKDSSDTKGHFFFKNFKAIVRTVSLYAPLAPLSSFPPSPFLQEIFTEESSCGAVG